MKSPEQAAFKTILIISMIIAVAMLPVVAKAEPDMKHSPPAFSEFDANGDGVVSEEEFNAFRSARMEAMAAAGRPMKGARYAPAFSDLDTNDDGVLSEEELVAGQKAHRQKMHEMHEGADGQHMHHGKDMKMPTFGDLDLDGDGCIDADEFAKHQADHHGKKQDN